MNHVQTARRFVMQEAEAQANMREAQEFVMIFNAAVQSFM